MSAFILTVFVTVMAAAESSFATDSVLLVYAHPDDETAIGGILGRLKEAGVSIHAIFITRGEGSPINHVDPAGMNADLAVGKLRPVELLRAADYFGFSKLIQLSHPDAGYTTNPDAFKALGLWDFAKIKKDIVALAKEVKPTVVLTMLPKHSEIHAHHQLTAQTVMELYKAGQLGAQVEAIYGEPELDWLPRGTFAKEERAGLRFSRAEISPVSGKAWGRYQSEGASFHKSQDTGYRKLTPNYHSYEILVPLVEKAGKRSIIRRLAEGTSVSR